MPTQTFFHLNKKKQKRLIEAARIEFSRVPLKEASIANIVKLADIPRGSFYQYFTGKHDLFLYLLKSLISTISQGFLAQLTVHGNDLFEAILGIFDLILWQSSSTREDLPQARISRLFQLNADLEPTQFIDQLDLPTIARQTKELLEQHGCEIAPEQEEAVLFLILAAGFSSLLAALRCPNRQDHFRAQLQTQLEIIRKGLTPA